MKERGRKIVHIFVGATVILLVLAFGQKQVMLGLLAALFAGLYLVNFRLRGYKDFFSEFFLKKYDRKEQLVPGQGALTLVAGALFVLAFASTTAAALGILAILSFGDGFASFVGRFGKTPLPWNRKKTLEGLLAFVLVGAAFSFSFLGLTYAVAYSILLGLLETVDTDVDDNLLIPAAGILLNAFLK